VIGLDTNVLVRYLAQDDPRQSSAASRLIESLTPENPGLLTTVVLAETSWVMEDVYGASRQKIAEIVEGLLQTRTLVVQDAEQCWQALSRFRTGSADFADYLIERTCTALGAETTYTFDRKAARRDDCAMILVA
jgi:predicted nucleic-acid-binding protein